MPAAGHVKTGAWDPEEDDLLYYWQSKVGNKWSEVAKHIPGRTGQQCAQRWRHKVNPNIRRDKWTAEEDAKLIELVKTFGVGRWAEIARNCDGRTDQQCMGRWRRHLDPSIRRDCWSAEEDAKLRQLHAQYGTSWSRISKCLKGRTSQQCRARWHQINNGRGKATAAGGGGGSSAASGARQPAAAASRRGGQSGKRKTSRRRADLSASEDEEDEEEELEEPDEEPEGEEEDEQAADSTAEQAPDFAADPAALAAAAAARRQCGQGGGSACFEDAAYAAALAAVSASYDYSLELPAPRQQQQLPHWDSGSAAAAGGQGMDDLAYPADQAEEADGQQEPAAYEEGEGSDDGDATEAAAAAAAAARGAGSRHYKVPGVSSHHHGGPVAAGAPAVYTGGVADGAPSPRAAWPSHWSPSRLLLSPPQLSRSEQQLMMRRGGGGRRPANAAVSDEPNDEETAGAETLLQMAHLLRRESCEFEPPSLRRSDFITASTPPKRHAAGQRPGADEDTPDELSPSPYKRARSSRSALFRGPSDVEGQGSHHHQHRLAGSSLQHKLRCQSDAGAMGSAVGAAAGRRQQSGLGRREQQQQLEFEGADEDDDQAVGLVAARGLGLQAELDAAADEDDEDSFMAAAGEDSDDCDDGGEQRGTRGSGAAAGHAAALRRLGGLPGPADLLGFGLAAAGSGGSVAGGQPGLGMMDPPARPSNASSLTGMPACAAEAAFLSPTPVARVPGSSSRSMVTPRRPPAQQSLMNMLGSPSFDRMAGYRSPPSAGRTQPSAATLAALQSPQPSCVHEPFWTPFTGLFKDTLFSRGTSATPDLPSAGKVRVGSLFSPAGKRSGSSSKGGSRRQRLSASSQGDDAPHASDGAGASSRPAAGTAFECEPGPSPACVLVQPLPSVSHRVVRRLDQHEAWGAAPHGSSPGQLAAAKQASAKLGGGGGSKADALLGIGFSLFSPVKKQRVPLFNEGGITIGASPAKPEALEDDPLAIAPLTHHLPCSSNGSPVQPDQGAGAALLEPLSAYVRSPLGLRAAGRAAGQSWQQPPASRLLSPGFTPQQQQEQQQQPEPMAVSPAEDQQPEAEQQQQQAVRQADPDTPVHTRAVSADNTSCSGTPNTPGQQRVGTSLLSAAAGGGAAAAASPTDYVTPQHRLRPSRPLAPLHKDCLIAAATKSLAGSLAAAAASQDERGNSQPTASTATGGGTDAAEQQQAGPEPGADAAADAAAAAGHAVAQAAANAAEAAPPQQPQQQQERPGSAPGSVDSSKLSRDQIMDSPLQPCQQLQSPSQWHQGMVAMLRNLQQTPLQPKACQVAGVPVAAVQVTDLAAAGSKACEGGQRAGSRALRRLQDELERGSSMAAATLAQQQLQRASGSKLAGTQAHAQQQQQFVVCHVSSAGEVQQVPLSAALAATPPGSAAALLGAVSAPMVLPLFSPAAAAGHGCGQAGAAAGSSPADAAAAARGASLMASVSLTPGVLSCARGEGPLVAVMHTPPGSSAAVLAAPRSAAQRAASPLLVAPGRAAGTPAVAWPVQQRPDGGLVVAALGAGDSPAAAGSAGGPMQLTPGALLSAGGAGPGGPRLVSIQPAAMLLSGVCAGPGLQFALQPSLAGAAELKVAAAPSSSAAAAAVTAGGGPAAASAGLDLRCESSHIVRSRLHALIDGV